MSVVVSLYFYPRPPRGGRPFLLLHILTNESISIHALREEGDRPRTIQESLQRIFLSTPSARRATKAIQDAGLMRYISIHALREEGDTRAAVFCTVAMRISIHALREEGDLDLDAGRIVGFVFLSTPSARRATLICLHRSGAAHNFYPRPPRGGRPMGKNHHSRNHQISIHALREEGDFELANDKLTRSEFLSTPSARRATAIRLCVFLAGGNFYPRPPRGGRLLLAALSTRLTKISIHALREEGDARP